jgi:DNA polymerase-1
VVFDVGIAGTVIDGTSHVMVLEDAAKNFLGSGLPPQEVVRWEGYITQRHLRRAFRDTEPLLRMYAAQVQCAAEQGVTGCVQLEQAVLVSIADMTRVGIPISHVAWQQLVSQVHREIDEDRAVLNAAGIANPGHAKNTVQVLSAVVGAPVTGLSRAAVEPYMAHPVVRAFHRYRRNTAFIGTFEADITSQLTRGDGRLRPRWNQMGAATGRITASDPPIINLRRDLRGIIQARPGFVLVHADYSCIDLRVVAEVSQDSVLIQVAQAGRDLHKHVASILLDKLPSEVTKEQRQMVKPVSFGAVYGMGADALVEYAETLDIVLTKQQAEAWLQKFFAVHVGVARWHSAVRADKSTECRTPSGRRRVLPADGCAFTQKLATIGQGTTADGMKRALCLMLPGLHQLGASVVATIYDAVLVEAPVETANTAARVVEQAMNIGMNYYLRTVPVGVNTELMQDFAGGVSVGAAAEASRAT